jgi:hypothetical protein
MTIDPDAQRRQQQAEANAIKWSRRSSTLSAIQMWLVIGPIIAIILLGLIAVIWIALG